MVVIIRQIWASDRKLKCLIEMNDPEFMMRQNKVQDPRISTQKLPYDSLFQMKSIRDVNITQEQESVGNTPLHIACQENRINPLIFQTLLERIDNPQELTRGDKYGNTPLHYLWDRRRREVLGFERVVRSTNDWESANSLVRDLWSKTIMMVRRYQKLKGYINCRDQPKATDTNTFPYPSQRTLHSLCYLKCPSYLMCLAMKMVPDDLNEEDYETKLSLSLTAAIHGASLDTLYKIVSCEVGSMHHWQRRA